MYVGGIMVHTTRTMILVSVSLAGLYLFRFTQSEERAFLPEVCKASIDSVFSENFKRKVTFFIQETYDQKNGVSELLSEIQAEFPVIRSVSASIDNAETVKIMINGYQPHILLNDSWAVTEQGDVFSRSYFAHDVLRELNQLSCLNGLVPEKLETETLSFFKDIPKPFFDLYDVCWDSGDSIWFHHKEKNYSMLVASGWDMSVDDLYTCQKVQERMIENQKRKRKNMRWICDLRFKGQVVTYPSFKVTKM